MVCAYCKKVHSGDCPEHADVRYRRDAKLGYVLIGAILVAYFLMGLIWYAGAQDHSPLHGVYETWKDDKGVSCCNKEDCDIAERVRITAVGYEVWYDGKWHVVPPAKDRSNEYKSPDGQAHVCISYYSRAVLCFVRGTEA